MSEYQFVNYSFKNGVATISFNAPKTLNALHQKMRLEIMALVDIVEKDDDVRVVVLTGEGKGFCAGADLAEGTIGYDSFVEQCAAEYTPWLMGIHDSSKLYIAAVNGAAAGIGSAVAMNCDLIMMAENAYLYQAFSAIGLMPDGGASWQLIHRVGYHKAVEMAVDAGRLTAQQCLDLGIASKVVEATELRVHAQQWAEHLASGAPLAQASVKNLMRRASAMSYQEVVDEEAVMQSRLIKSKDAAIGIQAFLSKTKPVFTGE